jgi:nucleoside-diphosphate-sugar epimerase
VTRKALVIGGTGQVGRAAARRLLADGWTVTVAHRQPGTTTNGAQSVQVDRQDDAAMDQLLGQGFDVVVDLLAFRSVHSAQLLRNAGSIGSVIMMSSAAVYQDAEGRTLQGVSSVESAPVLLEPLSEEAATVAPDTTTYAGNKRGVEIALLDSGIKTTILRPAGIHGPYSPQPREWFYVRRILDGRRVFVLGYGGRSSMHPVSAENLAEMIAQAAEQPGHGIFNAGDPGFPDERAMASAIAEAMGAEISQVLLPGMAPIAGPWSLPTPFFLSTSRAEKLLGYRPVASYRQSVVANVESIVAEHQAGTLLGRLSDRFGPPGLGCQVFVGGGAGPFDYAAEDKAIADLLN